MLATTPVAIAIPVYCWPGDGGLGCLSTLWTAGPENVFGVSFAPFSFCTPAESVSSLVYLYFVNVYFVFLGTRVVLILSVFPGKAGIGTLESNYRISANRRRGVYLFRLVRRQFEGSVYSRAAFITLASSPCRQKVWLLQNSVEKHTKQQLTMGNIRQVPSAAGALSALISPASLCDKAIL